MGRPLKIAFFANGGQHDIQSGRTRVTIGGGLNVTVPLGGVGGNPTNITPLTFLVHFKTSAGTAYNDGFILGQKGKKVFIVQSLAGGAATKTRCTLKPSTSIAASQMYISAKTPAGVAFNPVTIKKNELLTATTSYRFALVSAAQVSSYTGDGVYAVAEGA